MNAEESDRRTKAAMMRLKAAGDESALVAVFILNIWRIVVAGTVHVAIGFGVASMLGVSAWFGPPIALVSIQTLGRVYNWAVRSSRVKALERVADNSEAAKEGVDRG